MPVRYPTVEDVHQAFEKALPSSIVPFDQRRWSDLMRASSGSWESAGEGIEIKQCHGARLIRITWYFTIDKMNTSCEAELRNRAQQLNQQLKDLISGSPASFGDIIYPPNNNGDVVIECLAKGIVG